MLDNLLLEITIEAKVGKNSGPKLTNVSKFEAI
jgi:hypothetical protein